MPQPAAFRIRNVFAPASITLLICNLRIFALRIFDPPKWHPKPGHNKGRLVVMQVELKRTETQEEKRFRAEIIGFFVCSMNSQLLRHAAYLAEIGYGRGYMRLTFYTEIVRIYCDS